MKHLIALVLAGCLLHGCKKEAGHLSPAAMAPIVADLHIADAYSSLLKDSKNPLSDKNYDSLAKWTEQILARHHVTMREFNESMDWYRDRPLELDSLYAAVLPILEKEKRMP